MQQPKKTHITRSKTKFLLYAHLIFVVKYRKPLLLIYGDEVKKKIKEISGGKWRMEKCEVDRDHIHILIEYDPQISITNIVRAIKSQTTYELWELYEPELKRELWKKHVFWSPSYFACSIGNASKETIERYIQQQG